MTDDVKKKIAAAFPSIFDHASLNISISQREFAIFEQGIFSGSMDEKWNIFVWDTILCFSRSWTKHCIFKVSFERLGEQVILKHFYVNRKSKEYQSFDIENDTVLLKKLIQACLNRDDLYSDPRLELPLIKQTIDLGNYQNYKKSIGTDNVGMIEDIYQTLNSPPHADLFEVKGWEDFKKNISNTLADEPLISLYVQYKQDNSAKTFYFDKVASLLLGEICIVRKIKRA